MEVSDQHGYRRAAIDVAREFVREQAMGEWGDEVEERDAQKLAALLNAYAGTYPPEVVVPWAFGGTECLHSPGHEARCQCIGCPRKGAIRTVIDAMNVGAAGGSGPAET